MSKLKKYYNNPHLKAVSFGGGYLLLTFLAILIALEWK